MSSNDDDDGQTPKPDYEVGYGRPPKDRQFKPGESGNPKGRKRKPKSVQTQMQKVLSKTVSITEGGQIKLVPLQDVILRNLANKAAKGDLKATAFVFNLLMSPEYADKDTFDQTSLSPDDQTMLAEMMRQFSGGDSSDQSSQSNLSADEHAEDELSAQTQTPDTGREPNNPADKEN